MACNCNGIYDNKPVISILAERIFDNVRMDLDRSSLTMRCDLQLQSFTPLYCNGTGSFTPSLTVTPFASVQNAELTGIAAIPLTLTYNYNGSTLNAPCTLSLPFSARMNIPDASVWPYNIEMHYSLFCDNIVPAENGSFNVKCDGVTVTYITSLVPVTLEGSGQIIYNPISTRSVDNINSFQTTSFYPTSTDCIN